MFHFHVWQEETVSVILGSDLTLPGNEDENRTTGEQPWRTVIFPLK